MLWADMLANFISVMLLALLLLKLLKEASCLDADIWTDWDEKLPCMLMSSLVFNTTSRGGSSTRAVDHSRYGEHQWHLVKSWHLTLTYRNGKLKHCTEKRNYGSLSRYIHTYIHTYICQELAQCLQGMNPYVSIIALHAGTRITRRKMMSHIENNLYVAHSEKKCNRAASSFALEASVEL